MELLPDSPTLDCSAAEARARTWPGMMTRALHHDLIPRLARAHRPALMRITAPEVDAFTADLLAGDEGGMGARLDTLRQRGFSNEDLCLDLLAAAARKLGALWDDDRCDFTSVTIGVGNLQRLMRLLGPDGAPTAPTTPTAPSSIPHSAGLQLLLVRAPQEQHTFGLTMVAEFFRSAGWGVAGVSGMGGGAEATAEERAQVQHFDVVGFSVGSETQLEWVAAQIKALRRTSRNPHVVVMLGGPLLALQPQRAADLDADLCVPAAREAAALAREWVQKLVEQRVRGLQAA